MKPGPSVKKLFLNVLYWNINGRWRFLKDDYFFSWLKEFNLIFISETHFTKGQKFDLDDYKSYHNCFSDVNSRKPCSGVSAFIHSSIQDYVCTVDDSNYSNHIVVDLKGGHRISGSYIPPSDSVHYSEEFIWSIPSFFTPKDSDRIFLGGGDMNSRVGHIPSNTSWTYRKNPDKEVNTNGRTMKKICNKFNLIILNNLNTTNNNFDGDFTYSKDGKNSQVDLCIANEHAARSVSAFRIHKLPTNFSDHSPISTSLEIDVTASIPSSQVLADILSNSGDDTNRKRQRKLPTNINWEAYVNTATIDLQRINEELLMVDEFTQETVDKVITDLNEIITKSAKSCEIKTTENSTTPNIQNENLTVEQISAGISKKEIDGWNEIMENKNPGDLWKKIDWKDKTNEQLLYPSAESLGEHFQEKSTIINEIPFALNSDHPYVPVLDDPISREELEEASKRLKDKATADGWSPKLITSLSSVLFTILTLLMNVILQNAIYPSIWRVTMISAIFKNKGNSLLAKFYRPISLVHLLSKFFDFIMQKRFVNWFVPHDCQSAYQENETSADHPFLVRSLIRYCKIHKKKLFVVAIDFEGAFDKVSRHRLFSKLQLFGVGKTFLLCLIAIYAITDCIIYQRDTSFTYHLIAGIKQGLPLSPWLFLFYINDVFDFFDGIFKRDGITETLHLLIHADDTTILAGSRESAERKLRSLMRYCAINHISLQLSKCEFIVINGDETDCQPLRCGNEQIANVPYITLLGSHLSASGLLKDDLELHMTKRFVAVHKFYNFLRSNKLAPLSVKLEVLRACVTSALLHNCEAFGPTVPKQLESTYFSLIKACLGVRVSTPNKLVLIESGMPTLESMILSRQLNFFTKYVGNLKEGTPRKEVFDTIVESGCDYMMHYVQLLNTYHSKNDVKEHYHNLLLNDVNVLAEKPEKFKYKIYKQFNPELKPVNSLKAHHRFSRLRLSSHNMPIETGRWSRTSREERICTTCNSLGDERHFIYDCVDVDRSNLHDIPELHQLENYAKLNLLMENLDSYL